MGHLVDGNTKTFQAAGAIPIYARVKAAAAVGQVEVAGATEASIGVATRAAFAAGEFVAVRLWSAAGTHNVIASAAIAKGAELDGAASGQVVTAATNSELVALEAATAAGDIIEAVVLPQGRTV